MTNNANISTPIPLTGINFLQRVIGNFLYYGYAVDSIIIVDLRSLSADQSQGIQSTMDSLVWFLDYMSTHPDMTVRFYTSETILTNHIDKSYLFDPK